MSDHGEKQVAGGVDGLDGARPQTEAHQAPEFGDKYLDNTQVVQHHDCRVEENNSRHHLKGERRSETFQTILSSLNYFNCRVSIAKTNIKKAHINTQIVIN